MATTAAGTLAMESVTTARQAWLTALPARILQIVGLGRQVSTGTFATRRVASCANSSAFRTPCYSCCPRGARTPRMRLSSTLSARQTKPLVSQPHRQESSLCECAHIKVPVRSLSTSRMLALRSIARPHCEVRSPQSYGSSLSLIAAYYSHTVQLQPTACRTRCMSTATSTTARTFSGQYLYAEFVCK